MNTAGASSLVIPSEYLEAVVTKKVGLVNGRLPWHVAACGTLPALALLLALLIGGAAQVDATALRPAPAVSPVADSSASLYPAPQAGDAEPELPPSF